MLLCCFKVCSGGIAVVMVIHVAGFKSPAESLQMERYSVSLSTVCCRYLMWTCMTSGSARGQKQQGYMPINMW